VRCYPGDLLFSVSISIVTVLASETNDLLDAATRGQSLTDRGVWIGLLILLIGLLVWFAKVQLGKEAKLTDRLARLSEEANQVIRENTRVGEALRADMDAACEELKEIKREMQENRADRQRRSRGP
jgi:type VI protein secretion system component VasK